MWRHGKVNVNGDLVDTSWKTSDGVVTHINLAADAAPDVDINIDGTRYVRENLMAEQLADGITVPLITRDEMERRVKADADARAKARADYEGKPWPPVEKPGKAEKATDGK
jgi:hypothetical protein